MHKPILLIPEKTDPETEQVFEAWTKNGGQIKRLGKYWIRDEELARQQIAIYGNQAFSLVLAQIYNVELLSPDDSLIARLDQAWTKRIIQLKLIDQLTESDFPVFIKPVIPKMFMAGVFQTLNDFMQVAGGLEDTEKVLVSTIISDIKAEARCYVKDGMVKDLALYEGEADLTSATQFVLDFMDSNKKDLPKVVVIDIACSDIAGWFILEFNACWGAGLNSCKAENVIDCIIEATVNSREDPTYDPKSFH
ncbi:MULTISPECIES: ATP-grasp domain-containing protein [Niastella]|uniref:ATP-grasp domain-containing protein n=1 Tax=Niastella soli TaxID=2821487 RepID=A0ABS3YMS4_9BACT|nr:ATP-grasp domain-containing protein [Niastella soli]MBO9198897.1 ATP-grasp domain-containing protein [Niastella soli]